MEESTKNSVGRPTKYKEEFNELARKYCLLGATDKQLSDFLEISEATLNNWKTEHPEFLESIRKGKDVADMDVAEKLYKRAIGYQYKEESKILEGDKIVKKTETIKTMAPDTIAQMFWLKNRQKKHWRDTRNIDHTSGGDKIEMSREERDAEIERLIKKHQSGAE